MQNEITLTEYIDNEFEIIKLLKSTNREGIDNLIEFLKENNYFMSYGGYKHHRYAGGLAEHSLNVYHIAKEHNKNCKEENIIIAALLHDICKIQCNIPEINSYGGHGKKSVRILEEYLHFTLTPEERRAIRFHLGHKAHLTDDETKSEYKQAQTEELWHLIHVADSVDAGGYAREFYPFVEKVIDVFKL